MGMDQGVIDLLAHGHGTHGRGKGRQPRLHGRRIERRNGTGDYGDHADMRRRFDNFGCIRIRPAGINIHGAPHVREATGQLHQVDIHPPRFRGARCRQRRGVSTDKGQTWSGFRHGTSSAVFRYWSGASTLPRKSERLTGTCIPHRPGES